MIKKAEMSSGVVFTGKGKTFLVQCLLARIKSNKISKEDRVLFSKCAQLALE